MFSKYLPLLRNFGSSISDPWKILKIQRSATEKEIKTAYIRLVKEYHPDKETGNTKMFEDVQSAYSLLNDTSKRSEFIQNERNTAYQNNYRQGRPTNSAHGPTRTSSRSPYDDIYQAAKKQRERENQSSKHFDSTFQRNSKSYTVYRDPRTGQTFRIFNHSQGEFYEYAQNWQKHENDPFADYLNQKKANNNQRESSQKEEHRAYNSSGYYEDDLSKQYQKMRQNKKNAVSGHNLTLGRRIRECIVKVQIVQQIER